MPTVKTHHYKAGAAILVVLGLAYGFYHLYSNSTGNLLSRARQALSINDYDAARSYLGRVLGRNPNHVDALVLLSRITLRGGDYPATESALNRVLSQDPGNGEAHSLMADVCLSQCKFGKALEELSKSPADGEQASRHKGRKALATAGLLVGASDTAKILAEAQASVQSALQVASDQPEARLANALVLVETGNGAAAKDEALAARQKLGSSFLSEWVVGKALYQSGDMEGALAAFDLAEQKKRTRHDLAPGAAWNMELYLYRGLSLIKEGHIDEAERALSIARENDPASTEPTLALVNLHLIRAVEQEMGAKAEQDYLRYYQRAVDELSRQPRLLESNPAYRYQLSLIQIYLRDYKNAIRNLEALSEKDPPYLQALNELGNQYNYQANYSKAVRTYQRILNFDPSNLVASYNLGTILIRNRDIPGARDQLQSVVNREPGWLDARLNLGLCCRLSGDYKRAEESYQFILKKNPNDVNALIGLGLVASAKGDVITAGKYYTQARDLHPDRSEPFYYLGQVALEEGKAAEAQSMFERCLVLNPENEFAAMSLVEINLKKGTWDQARTRIDSVIANPNARLRTIAENALCLVEIMSGNLEEGKKKIAPLVQILPEVGLDIRGAILNNQALLASAERHDDTALDNARKVVEALPKSSDAYYNLGTLQMKAGNFPEAILAFRRALEFDPKHSSAQYNLAVAEASLNRWDSALQTLSTLAESSEASSEVLGNLAEAYLGSGQPAEAMKIIEPAVSRFPLAVELQTLKTKALIATGDFAAASSFSSDVVKQFPQDGGALMVRGVAAYHTGDFSEAESRLRKAYQVLGKDPAVELNLAAFLIEKGGYETLTEAETLLGEVEKSGMFVTPGYNQRALLAFRRADYGSAKKFLDLSLQQDPNQPLFQDLLRRIGEL